MKKIGIILVVMALFLTACGQKQGLDSKITKQTATEKSSNSTPVTSLPKITPTSTKKSTPTNPKVDTAEKDKKIEIAYHMNLKNYLIIPNEKTGNKKVVLLTFDDAPKSTKTLQPIIDTLSKHNAKAIFFCNGYRIKEHPELLKLITESGNTIGNHSWDHNNLKGQTKQKIDEQLATVQSIVKQYTGTEPRFFRPPYAGSDDLVKKEVKSQKLLFMTWSDGSLDWTMAKMDPTKRTQAIIDNVNKYLHPGANILMHELPWTGQALDALLTNLEDKGYSFVDPRAIKAP